MKTLSATRYSAMTSIQDRLNTATCGLCDSKAISKRIAFKRGPAFTDLI